MVVCSLDLNSSSEGDEATAVGRFFHRGTVAGKKENLYGLTSVWYWMKCGPILVSTVHCWGKYATGTLSLPVNILYNTSI